jgi:hypothetical protein
MIPSVMAGTVCGVVRDLLQFLRTCLHSHTRLAAENLFLRKQLAFYLERETKPRRASDATRVTLVLLGELSPRTFCAFRREFRAELQCARGAVCSLSQRGMSALLNVTGHSWMASPRAGARSAAWSGPVVHLERRKQRAVRALPACRRPSSCRSRTAQREGPTWVLPQLGQPQA